MMQESEQGTEGLQADPPDELLIEVQKVVKKKHVNNLADQLLKEQKFEDEYREPPTHSNLFEGLQVPRPPIQYGVQDLVVKGGNTLITASYKVGKTDLILNLLKSYCDDLPFLGKYTVQPLEPNKKVCFWDFELDKDYAWNLIKLFNIQNQHRGIMQNWRGYPFGLQSSMVRDRLVEFLATNNIQVLILDPFGAAYTGEENSNSEVRQWLRYLDEVKERAGIREVFMTIHTGRAQFEEGQERARGATAANDWMDSGWTYTRDTVKGTATPHTSRFMTAMGRAVDVPEFQIEWDKETHALTAVDGGGSRQQVRASSCKNQIVAFLTIKPGAHTSQIKDSVTMKAETVANTLRDMVSDGDLIKLSGPGGKQQYYLPNMVPNVIAAPVSLDTDD